MTTSDAHKRNAERKAAMTPAETLNRASETLRRLATEARIRDDSAPWKYDAESGRITSDIKGGWDAMSIGVVCDYGLQVKGGVDGYNHASGLVNQDRRHGEFIALMDPDLARMLADWLGAHDALHSTYAAEAVVAAMEANATHQPRNDTDVVSPADEPPIDPRAGSVRLAGCSEGGREQE